MSSLLHPQYWNGPRQSALCGGRGRTREALLSSESQGVGLEVLLRSRPALSLIQGATIRRDEHSGAVVVARIMRGGAADRSGE